MNEMILELSALLLCIFCFADSIRGRSELYIPLPDSFHAAVRDSHFAFMGMLVTIAMSAVTDMGNAWAENMHASDAAVFIVNTFYFLFHNILPLFCVLYIMGLCGPARDRSDGFFRLLTLPAVLGELLVFINIFYNICFYVDEAGLYQRGPAIWFLYGTGAFYALYVTVYFLRFGKDLPPIERRAALVMIGVFVAGVIIQAVFAVPVEVFFESVCLFGYMALIEQGEITGDSKKAASSANSAFAIVMLIFFMVMLMNVSLTLRLTESQADRVGNARLEVIGRDLENTIRDAESKLMLVSEGAWNLIDSGASKKDLEEYFYERTDEFSYDGSFLHVYVAGPDWHIIPDFDAPSDFKASERSWYMGALAERGEIYIEEPYQDLVTGDMCFTMSKMLDDGETVAAMDLNLSKAQESIIRMTEGTDQTAMIITKSGLIAGYSDESLVGERADEKLPEYNKVIRKVMSTPDHDSFRTSIKGKAYTVFSSETSNHWYLILNAYTRALYAEGNRQVMIIAAVNLLMMVVIAIFYLISTRNRLISARALAEAEEANRAKTAFLSNMSHEIRTPMNAIIGLDSIALRDPDISPHTRDELEKIGSSAKHLLSLINDILDMSRIESGRLELKEERFSLRELMDQIIVIIGGQCEDKGLVFETDVSTGTDESFIGDDLKLKQVLINILGNSVKFTESPGKVSFSAEKTAETDEECALRFTMKDTGIGMDRDFIPKLFEAFSQEDATSTNKYGGSGLGMAITKNLVGMMGGEISVESVKGRGSVFTVALTLKRAPDEIADIKTDAAAYAEDLPLDGLHVLVAEDNEINAEILMDLLDMEDITSEWAGNGKIAVELFEAGGEGHFDAVLMDMRMPEMDGVEATRRIRNSAVADAKTIPIIALTANAFEEDVKQCLEAGMDAHLAKPVDIELLKATLTGLIKKRGKACPIKK